MSFSYAKVVKSDVCAEIELEKLREEHKTAIKDNEQLFHEIREKDQRIHEQEAAENILKIKLKQSLENCKALTIELNSVFAEMVANKAKVKELQEKLDSNVVRISLPLITVSVTLLVSMYFFRGGK